MIFGSDKEVPTLHKVATKVTSRLTNNLETNIVPTNYQKMTRNL